MCTLRVNRNVIVFYKYIEGKSESAIERHIKENETESEREKEALLTIATDFCCNFIPSAIS